VLASSASTDSAMSRELFNGDTEITADSGLLHRVHELAVQKELPIRKGNIFATDWFYHPDDEFIGKIQKMGALAVDMETAALYALAKRHNRRALTILSVSDVIPTGERASHETRQNAFGTAIDVVLEAVL